MAIVGFKDGQGGIEQLTLGHDDDVEAWRDVVTTKNLSNQSFRTISLNGSAKLLRRRDAEASYRALVGKDEYGGEAPVDADASLITFLELGAAPDALLRPEPGQLIRC